MAERLAAGDGMVFIEDHMFHLVDDAAPGDGPTEEPPLPRGRLVTVGAGTVLATFNSELEDSEPYVSLEYWSAEPPEPEGTWEGSARERLTVAGGRLSLVSGVSMLGESHHITVPPGRYELGVWCRGRAEARAADRASPGSAAAQHGVEKWLIRLWPAAGA